VDYLLPGPGPRGAWERSSGGPGRVPGGTVDHDQEKVENGDFSDFHFWTIYDHNYMWLKYRSGIMVQFSHRSP
jgi:hypothetical protein